MQVIKHPNDIHGYVQAMKKEGKTIGLIPTMGALHEGHFSLVREGVSQNDITIVSIFVNPLQFNNPSDLSNYPRTLEEDLVELKECGVDVVFLPDVKDMYPDSPLVTIAFGEMAKVMEGEFRPGHFDGVGVVVAKLFNIVSPDNAYFGLKDLQQFLLIKRMVHDLSFPVEMHGLPTVRELSGLAMSSRNRRLSNEGKLIAANIYKGLNLVAENWSKGFPIEEVKAYASKFYKSVKGLDIEYLSFVNPEDLSPIEQNQNQSVAICVAAYVEGVRLIDNLYLR